MYSQKMPEPSTPEIKHTRRETLPIMAIMTFLTTSGCMSSSPESTSPPPVPNRLPSILPSVATPGNKVEATQANAEGLNPLFQAAVNEAAILSGKFPTEFSDAKTLKDDLLKLQRSGDLLIQPIDPTILATVRPQLNTLNGLITDLKAQVFVNPQITSFSPIEQVLLLTHELSHQKDQTQVLQSLLQNLKGKPDSPENISGIEREISKLTFQMESKELFKNCRQLFAVKSNNPGFRTRPPIPFEQPLPNSSNRTDTLYSVYLQVRNTPNPEQDPRWKAAVGNFVL